ncbi:Protein Y37D8A.3 [Aphelenchoides avenae]|nr:Protein Y37D8A.3 [Aphelenchus avenae]
MPEDQQTTNNIAENAQDAAAAPKPRWFAGIRMMLVDFQYARKHWNLFQSMVAALLLLSLVLSSTAEIVTEDALVLVPHGEDPESSKNRIVIPQPHDGSPVPLPCVVSGIGMREHGQTFTKGNFHYNCNNGTAEVIGIRHRCNVNGETVTYEQRSTCFENGQHYDVGESFRNGSFRLICKDNGIAIEGCFVQNRTDDVIMLGESRIIGNYKHNCEVMDKGKIRYTVHLVGCRKGEDVYHEGQIWTDKHIRYQCLNGAAAVLGCIDDGGLFIDLGRDVLMQGIIHRCYKINNVSFYHRFNCEGKSLQECVNAAPVPKRRTSK